MSLTITPAMARYYITPDTAVKSTGFTAVVNTYYYINTSGGAFTMTLPAAPTSGQRVGFIDVRNTFNQKNLTIGRNGLNIMGVGEDLIADQAGAAVELEYIDATSGWVITTLTKTAVLYTSEITEATPRTAAFTASVNTRYYIDTTSAAFTMTLPPAPATGDRVGFIDYGFTFDTNNLTIGRNGLEIMNLAEDLVINTRHYSGTLEYSGVTRGWILV